MRNTLVAFLFVNASFAWAEPLAGVVLQENGAPAAGAQVHVAAIFQSPPLRLSTITDAKGEFRVELPPVSSHKGYMLVARWESQGIETWNSLDAAGKTVPMQGQPLPSQTLRLRTAGRLHGKLLQAEDGRPIAGAKVFVDTGEVVITDERGAFEIAGLSMKDHALIPSARGRLRQYVLFDTTKTADTELELRLPRGAVIKGRVVDENGKGVASAFLKRASSGNALTLNGWDEPCTEDGSFEYGGLSPERLFYGLKVEAPGLESKTLKVDVKQATDEFEQTVVLHKAAKAAAAPQYATAVTPSEKKAESKGVELPRRTIAGVVSDSKGMAVKGAKIRWGTFQWDSSVEPTVTDDDGQFALDRVPVGKGAILVIADGFAPQFVPVEATGSLVKVNLSRGVAVKGVVVGTSGAPVAQARIIASVRCSETGFCNPIWLDDRSTETNDNGVFELRAVPETGVLFDILKEGYSEQRGVSLTVDEKFNEIKLLAGGAVCGLVIDPQEKRVRNFKIRVRIPRGITPNGKSGGYFAGFDWYGVTFTRNDGVFVMTDIGTHTWIRTIITSPGIGYAINDQVQSQPLDQVGDPADLTIRLSPFVPLVVKIEEAATGEAVADAGVALLEDDVHAGPRSGFNWGYDDLWAKRSRTNKDGEARFEEPGCEDGTVVVSAEGFARQRIAWTDGATELTVSLVPEAVLEGQVRLKGEPLREGYVRLRSSNSDFLSIDLSETGGRYQFDRLAAGKYHLEIAGNNGQSLQSHTFGLEAGHTHEKNIDLE